MKPQLLKVATGLAQSFSVRHDLVPFFNNKWHYHTEVELILLDKGTGTQVVGDSIQAFKDGDMVLIGANLPHYWRFDDHYFAEGSTSQADVTVAHFNESFLGGQFLHLPENKIVKDVLEKAKSGIQILGNTRTRAAGLLRQMPAAEPFKKLMLLLEILGLVGESSETATLSSSSFLPNLRQSDDERINAIYEFSLSNFSRKITLEEAAEVACISRNSFCRYFKTYTGKTYSHFILECRIGHSCKLLIDDKLSIKQICYESGFNTFASFHKYFKKLTGKTPMAYQNEFKHRR